MALVGIELSFPSQTRCKKDRQNGKQGKNRVFIEEAEL